MRSVVPGREPAIEAVGEPGRARSTSSAGLSGAPPGRTVWCKFVQSRTTHAYTLARPQLRAQTPHLSLQATPCPPYQVPSPVPSERSSPDSLVSDSTPFTRILATPILPPTSGPVCRFDPRPGAAVALARLPRRPRRPTHSDGDSRVGSSLSVCDRSCRRLRCSWEVCSSEDVAARFLSPFSGAHSTGEQAQSEPLSLHSANKHLSPRWIFPNPP